MGDVLKWAGFDFIVIKGRSETPVYLEITDGEAKLRKADALTGKDTFETVDLIREELGSQYAVVCCGPAGENLVKWASVIGDKSHAFGRSGLGAVFGSKRLKAIAVYGTQSIHVADPPKFMKAAKDAIKDAMADKEYIQLWRDGGTWGWSLQKWLTQKQGTEDESNLEVLQWPEAYFKRYKVHNVTCGSCPVGCKAHMTLIDGKYENLNFAVGCTSGTMAAPFGTGLGIERYDDVGYCAVAAQKYGFDTMTVGGLISWATELFQKGIISGEDTGGLELQRGNVEIVLELMRQMAYREGFGALLADGPQEAVKRIGRGSEDYILQWKGFAMSPTHGMVDPRTGMTTTALTRMVNYRGHVDTCRFPWMNSDEDDMQLKTVQKYWKHIGIPEQDLDKLIDGKAVDLIMFLKYSRSYCAVLSALGICELPILPEGWPIDRLAKAYSTATGMEISPEELVQAGERILTLLKAFNMRHGAVREDDAAPRRYYLEPLVTLDKKVHPPLREEDVRQYVDRYYVSMGWDQETGKPMPETLKELGLEETVEHLWPEHVAGK